MLVTILLYGTILILLTASALRDRKKTKSALSMARSMASGMIFEIIGIMAIVAWVLAVLPPETIGNVLGGENEVLSTLYGAAIGTVTIIPAFIAFPLADSLLQQGASLLAVAAFITTLTMVGFATMPLELKHFGRRFTVYRNLLSFAAALIIALLMGVLL